MTIEEGLRTHLTAHAGLTALVASRIFMPPMPQDVVFPAVTFWKVTAERQHAMVADAGMVGARIQVDAWGAEAAGKLALIQVCEQVRAALQDFRGNMGTVEVQRVFIEDESDMPFDPATRSHHRLQEYMIWHRE